MTASPYIYTANRHRFAGKEDQTFAELPYIDFGARLYDPATVRWNTSDQMAEKCTMCSVIRFSGQKAFPRTNIFSYHSKP